MKTKPLYFSVLAGILLMVAFSFPIQILILYDYSFSDILLTLNHLSVLNWIVMLMSSVVAMGLLNVDGRLNSLVVILIASVICNNYIVGYMGLNYSLLQSTLASGLFLIPFVPLTLGKMRALISDPKMHWWKTPERFNLKIPVGLKTKGIEVSMDGSTINISKTGMLIECSQGSVFDKLIENKSKISILVSLEIQGQKFSYPAEIVRVSKIEVPRVKQVALHFKSMPWFKKMWFEYRLQTA